MDIRTLTVKDAATIRKMASICSPLDLHTPYTYWLITYLFGDLCFIAHDETVPIAFITALCRGDMLFIWQVGVVSSYRRRGVSNQLLGCVFKRARDIGVSKVRVTISEENEASQSAFRCFCRRNGYAMTAAGNVEITDYLVPSFKESEIVYEISLARDIAN